LVLLLDGNIYSAASSAMQSINQSINQTVNNPLLKKFGGDKTQQGLQ